MDRIQQKQESLLQPKLSIIFKQQVNRIPQTFGAFYDGDGKYCALAAVSKCFGYDVEAHKMINDATASSADSIPMTVIERIEVVFQSNVLKNIPIATAKRRITIITV
jgi:hypothetical protein